MTLPYMCPDLMELVRLNREAAVVERRMAQKAEANGDHQLAASLALHAQMLVDQTKDFVSICIVVRRKS